MARPLSPEKHQALLMSAMQAVAEQGVLATTSIIAKKAGVAEGTLFTYFENKGKLFQQLYLHLKKTLSDSVMPNYPHHEKHQVQLQHLFQGYVTWGLKNPEGRRALTQLMVSGLISEDSIAIASEPFLDVYHMFEEAIVAKVFMEAPIPFMTAIIEDIANTTIHSIKNHEEDADYYMSLGFEVVWKALQN